MYVVHVYTAREVTDTLNMKQSKQNNTKNVI